MTESVSFANKSASRGERGGHYRTRSSDLLCVKQELSPPSVGPGPPKARTPILDLLCCSQDELLIWLVYWSQPPPEPRGQWYPRLSSSIVRAGWRGNRVGYSQVERPRGRRPPLGSERFKSTTAHHLHVCLQVTATSSHVRPYLGHTRAAKSVIRRAASEAPP
jgi:hypothetical protein